MTRELLTAVVPIVIYFVFLFAIFSFMEVLILFYLSHAESHYGERVARVVAALQANYGKAKLLFNAAGLALLLTGLYFASPILKGDVTHTPELTIFSGLMLVGVSLTYHLLTHAKVRLQIARVADRIAYWVLSILVYAFMIILVHQRFPQYKQFINDQIVTPAYAAVTLRLQEAREHELLTHFRQMLRQNLCPYKDFRDQKNAQDIIHQFVYVTTEAGLASSSGPLDPSDPGNIIRGKTCTDGNDTFVLTSAGNWYWVSQNALR